MSRWRAAAALLAALAVAADVSVATAAPSVMAFCNQRSGSLAREDVPASIRAMAEPIAHEQGVDPDLVLAVIAVESGYNANAVSPKHAQGLMQLIPATAKRFGVDNTFNPVQNIRGGTSYLRWLKDRFSGDTALVLAGYNAGEGAVDAHGGIPPFAETRKYVRDVARHYVCRPKDVAVRAARWKGLAETMNRHPLITPTVRMPKSIGGGGGRLPTGPVRIRVSNQTTSHAALGNLRCSRHAELRPVFRVCNFQ